MHILWCSFSILSFLFLNALPKEYVSSFPQSLSDTDSWLNYKGSTESNEPTEISSYRVTPAAPLTLTSAFEPRQMSFSFTIPKSEWVMFAGTEVLWRSALHANVVLHPSSPTNQPFCSKLICIQYLGIPPICTAWKYTFHSSPVRCSWNHLELSLNRGAGYMPPCISILDFCEAKHGQCFDLADV